MTAMQAPTAMRVALESEMMLQVRMSGAGCRHRVGGQRAEHAAPPQLAEEAAHFTWWAMTLSLILSYVALGMIFFSTSSSFAL